MRFKIILPSDCQESIIKNDYVFNGLLWNITRFVPLNK